jgi:hypothetical protein
LTVTTPCLTTMGNLGEAMPNTVRNPSGIRQEFKHISINPNKRWCAVEVSNL